MTPQVLNEPVKTNTSKRNPRPFLFLFLLLNRVAPGIEPRVQKSLIRALYQLLNARCQGNDVATMNFGYSLLDGSHLELSLSDEEETQRYGLQLYYRVANAIQLHGRDVLEVGCGRGGGTAFIARSMHTLSMTGVDFSAKAIAFCNDHYRVEGLDFKKADAEYLPFQPHSFDAVMNVESSHCYPYFKRFLSEVWRVLRPQGHFLFADFRLRQHVPVLREEILRAGFIIMEEENITANVVRAMELDSKRRLALIRRLVPSSLQSMACDFYGVTGTRSYDAFRDGTTKYLRFALQKT